MTPKDKPTIDDLMDKILSDGMFGAFNPTEQEQELLDICRDKLKAALLSLLESKSEDIYLDRGDNSDWTPETFIQAIPLEVVRELFHG